MKTVKFDIYEFEELSKEAKEKAILKDRDFNLVPLWWEFVYDDFVNLCSYLGIAVDKDVISFEGFYSQGNGSGFNADVDIIKLKNAIESEEWKIYAPMEKFNFCPHGIDRRVMGLIEKGGIQLNPKIINRNRGNGVIADLGGYPANGPRFHDYTYGEIDALEEWLYSVATQLNKFLYKSLETEYDHLTSDEAVAEALTANGIPFTADGRSAIALENLIKTNN
ncbi:MAG: hypothetical protein M3O71_21100 [Bacteroidota bacterium]|nr:hypothetical protein [Bacteroidota bacterium]